MIAATVTRPTVDTVAMRIPVTMYGTASGRSTVRNSLQMRRQFGDELDFIVGGFSTGGNRPSEIKSLGSGSTLRSAS